MATIVEQTPQTEVKRKISKVKLAKNGGVIVEFEQTIIINIEGKPVEQVADVPYGGRNLPHPDLLHAFTLLRSHLAIICSQLDGREPILDEIEDDEAFLENFTVTGFSIGGSGEHEGVVLIGNRKIKRGTLNLVSTFIKFDDLNNPYEYQDEFNHLISHATSEAELYVEGKIAPNVQGEFDFNKDDDDDNNDLE